MATHSNGMSALQFEAQLGITYNAPSQKALHLVRNLASNLNVDYPISRWLLLGGLAPVAFTSA